uniref:Uncharacterized protein n=1 Tax=viral metagenome TaxID=1070528 RepID=A0A6C0JH96_9ZZZZ
MAGEKWFQFVTRIKNETGAKSLKAAMKIASKRKSEWKRDGKRDGASEGAPMGKTKKTTTRRNKSGKNKM